MDVCVGAMRAQQSQKDLLAKCLADGEAHGGLEHSRADQIPGAAARHKAAKRSGGSLSALAGGGGVYAERARPRHKLMRQRERELARDRATFGMN